jgi:hypothetical protein
MAYSAKMTSFAQSVYLGIKNQYFNNISGTDGQTFISQIVDFLGQYLDELETVTDSGGQPVYWNFAKTLDYTLGTATLGQSVVGIDSSILNVVTSQHRQVKVVVGGEVITYWDVVSPNQLTSDTYSASYYDKVTIVGGSMYFSRTFNAQEDGGTILGDVITSLTRPSTSDDSVLSIVIPKQLLVYGVMKNASLPDIVRGELSPSFVQKYNDLLSQAILFNNASADSNTMFRDDLGNIRGVGF